jgi:BMFP domain-containing protein YqiC
MRQVGDVSYRKARLAKIARNLHVSVRYPEATMTQNTGRFFDEMARLANDAAGVAEGFRREVETIVRGQAERILRGMDVVTREEFEASKEMAAKAREENERLAARLAELEAKLGASGKR